MHAQTRLVRVLRPLRWTAALLLLRRAGLDGAVAGPDRIAGAAADTGCGAYRRRADGHGGATDAPPALPC